MTSLRQALMGGAATCAVVIAATPAFAEVQSFDIPAQSARTAIQEFGRQSGLQILASQTDVGDQKVQALKGEYEPREALRRLLVATNLRIASDDGRTVTLAPQSGSAAGDGADGTVQALIVTAQKREEDIQDVPIAISAFTQEDLTRSQVAGGPDLVTQIPNFTFTKTNFSSYSIQIRGIGTQAISATTDPAVAVAFNNTPFIRNRFFEQEFYDLERVEVLRGPQGTLYGRNATAGVVNIISAKPKFRYEAKLSGDLGNFSSSRLEGMVNIPLVEDKVALRVAGAWTKRDGYATNELTGNPIDGRDLWSTRVSLRIAPTDRINANLIWEHFQENDDRLRSGKQLCKKDVVTEAAGFPTTYFQSLPNYGQMNAPWAGVQASLSQGCARNSLYDPASFQTPTGLMLPYYVPLGAIGLPIALSDPYVNAVQSHDLRAIESTLDPDYRAHADLGELQVSFDLTDALTLSSETAYSVDQVWSLEDFNRFNMAAGAWEQPSAGGRPGVLTTGPNGGIFCDPQLGCSDRLVAVDLSTAEAHQFSQEFRLSSNFGGPFNFSFGTNFLRADSFDKYYVFINSISLIAAAGPVFNGYPPYVGGETDNLHCQVNGSQPGNPNGNEPLNGIYPVVGCTYIDPNPISSLNDQGHNYFLSNNPYKLISYAVFGEAYYKISDAVKLTAGLRWTVDKKEAPRIPTWILATQSVGYPVAEVVEQEWREPTGRLAIDWKPDLSFTDETLLYAAYAHGYKAGGANPPGFVRGYYADIEAAQSQTSGSATRPKTFDPEFVNAFEFGSKNTFLGGRATMNLAGFYYDYTGYQVSEIVDRSAFNRNFDAEVWGAELEAEWRPRENLKLGFKGGYESTRIADGEQAIDLMDRTAGDPRWTLLRPFPTFASSCIVPTWLLVGNLQGTAANPELVGLGGIGGGNPGGCELAYASGLDPATQRPYQANPPSSWADIMHSGVIDYTAWSTNVADFPGWPDATVTNRTYPGWDPSTAPNGGEGIAKPLGGNQLPNAPHYTATVTGDYTLPLSSDWLMTLHSDVHWQSQSWWRVFNDSTFDKLHPYFTMNLAAIFTNEDAGWNIMAYIKNVTDETAITGAFLNSDDTGLTTNVFLTEPRLYGLRVTKNWSGGPLLGAFGGRHDGPYPLTVELGGQVQRIDAPTEPMRPSFADAFGPVDNFADAQDDDFDWGDGREVTVKWQPKSSPWLVSATYRYGEANSGTTRARVEHETDATCAFGGPFASFCSPNAPSFYYQSRTDFSDTVGRKREDHTLVDFTVGRDVGLGGLSRSVVAAGLRYASFQSSSDLTTDGIPDWNFPAGWYFPGYDITRTRYRSHLDSNREFKGAGPVVSWDASIPLLGDEDIGHVDVDWSISGGVLFGKQKAALSGSGAYRYYNQNHQEDGILVVYPSTKWIAPDASGPTAELNTTRSKSVNVPLVSASLGLSYAVDRFNIGAGYRWERYFNVIDGGYAQSKKEDRTIDGPYFKIAVGFGG